MEKEKPHQLQTDEVPTRTKSTEQFSKHKGTVLVRIGKGLIKKIKTGLDMTSLTQKWISCKIATNINPQAFGAFAMGLIPGFRIEQFLSPIEAEKIVTSVDRHTEEY